MRIENRNLLYKPPEVSSSKEPNSSSRVSLQKDRVEISEEARSLLKSPQAKGKAVSTSGSRIEFAKSRIAEGFYFHRDVLSVVADELLREFETLA